jgi:hypothetical protein
MVFIVLSSTPFFDRGFVEGGRHVVNDGVEKGLHSFVLIGRPGDNRCEGQGERAGADALLKSGDVWLNALHVCRQRLAVLFNGNLHHLCSVLGCADLELLVNGSVGDGVHLEGGSELGVRVLPVGGYSELGVVPDDGGHINKVKDTKEVLLGSDGEL